MECAPKWTENTKPGANSNVGHNSKIVEIMTAIAYTSTRVFTAHTTFTRQKQIKCDKITLSFNLHRWHAKENYESEKHNKGNVSHTNYLYQIPRQANIRLPNTCCIWCACRVHKNTPTLLSQRITFKWISSNANYDNSIHIYVSV